MFGGDHVTYIDDELRTSHFGFSGADDGTEDMCIKYIF